MGQPVLSHLHHRCRRRPAGLTARVRPEGGSPYALALTVVWKAVECKVVPLQPGAKGQTRAEVSSSSAEARGSSRRSILASGSLITVGLPGGTHVSCRMDLCICWGSRGGGGGAAVLGLGVPAGGPGGSHTDWSALESGAGGCEGGGGRRAKMVMAVAGGAGERKGSGGPRPGGGGSVSAPGKADGVPGQARAASFK